MALRLPPVAYLFTFAMALVSMTLLGIVVGGLVLIRQGGSPFDAIDGVGLVCFIASAIVGYLFRLIFWDRSSPGVRTGVRRFVTALLSLLPIAAAVAVALAATTPTPGWLLGFLVMGCLCQIATIWWLVRYRTLDATTVTR